MSKIYHDIWIAETKTIQQSKKPIETQEKAKKRGKSRLANAKLTSQSYDRLATQNLARIGFRNVFFLVDRSKHKIMQTRQIRDPFFFLYNGMLKMSSLITVQNVSAVHF